jgi:hypothetical protein
MKFVSKKTLKWCSDDGTHTPALVGHLPAGTRAITSTTKGSPVAELTIQTRVAGKACGGERGAGPRGWNKEFEERINKIKL